MKKSSLPNQIIGKLSEKDQNLLNNILQIEKRKLHVQKIKPNSRDEKEIVKEIVKVIDEAVKNAN